MWGRCCASQGSGSSPSSRASQMSSSSSCMRGTRHLHRCQTVPHIVLGEPLTSAQCCRTLASTTVCFFLTSWMSLVPWNLHFGMKSCYLRQLRQGGAFHQPILSSWAAGNLKPTACFLPAPVLGHC